MDDERMRGISSFVDFVHKKEEEQTLSAADKITMSSVMLSLIAITQEINAVLGFLKVTAEKKSTKELLQAKARETYKYSHVNAFALRYLLELHSGNLSNITKIIKEELDKYVYSDKDVKDAMTLARDTRVPGERFVVKFANILLEEMEEGDEEEQDTSIPTT